jgi:hypothetical protein
MGDIIAMSSKLPAHLQRLSKLVTSDWASGTTGGFPVISTKSKVFHVRRGDEHELIMNPKDPDSPASSIQVVILKTHPGTAKTYYKDKYVEGSEDKPTCGSPDGITPFPDAENRQATKCAICPHNQWGSRISEDGKKGKSCSDVKRLAVAPYWLNGQLNDPMLLRIPPTSLKTWDIYQRKLAKHGLTPAHVVTQISFDSAVSHQSLLFREVQFITEEMLPKLEQALEDPLLDSIVGTSIASEPVEALPPPKEEAPPPAKPPAKKARTPKKKEEAAAPPPPPAPAPKQEEQGMLDLDGILDEPAAAEEVVEDDDELDLSDDDFDSIDFGDDD